MRLYLNVNIQAENTVVFVVSLLSFNGHVSSHFDTIYLKLSAHAYFTALFHSMWSKCKNSKNRFYDVITSLLYCMDKKSIKYADILK